MSRQYAYCPKEHIEIEVKMDELDLTAADSEVSFLVKTEEMSSRKYL